MLTYNNNGPIVTIPDTIQDYICNLVKTNPNLTALERKEIAQNAIKKLESLKS